MLTCRAVGMMDFCRLTGTWHHCGSLDKKLSALNSSLNVVESHDHKFLILTRLVPQITPQDICVSDSSVVSVCHLLGLGLGRKTKHENLLIPVSSFCEQLY